MVLQLLFSIFRGSHKDTVSKGLKLGEVIFSGRILINSISSSSGLWKVNENSDSMVQGIWPKYIFKLDTVSISGIELDNVL